MAFPGQYEDAETGLHYNYFRYYDPSTGRYLTPDPIGLDGGINLFVYALNNSVMFIDPYGLTEWQFHKGHHGGDHFQKGNLRYDAKTLKPIPHKGKIPPGLSKSAIKNLKSSGAWAKYLKLGGKAGGGALAILLELALPAEAHAPPLHMPSDPLLSAPPSIDTLPLINVDEELSPCK